MALERWTFGQMLKAQRVFIRVNNRQVCGVYVDVPTWEWVAVSRRLEAAERAHFRAAGLG